MLSSKRYQSEALKTPYPPQKNVVPELSKKLSVKMPLPKKNEKTKRRKVVKRREKDRRPLGMSQLVVSSVTLFCHSEQKRPEPALGAL